MLDTKNRLYLSLRFLLFVIRNRSYVNLKKINLALVRYIPIHIKRDIANEILISQCFYANTRCKNKVNIKREVITRGDGSRLTIKENSTDCALSSK